MSFFINVIGITLIGLIVWWFWVTPKKPSTKSKSNKRETK